MPKQSDVSLDGIYVAEKPMLEKAERLTIVVISILSLLALLFLVILWLDTESVSDPLKVWFDVLMFSIMIFSVVAVKLMAPESKYTLQLIAEKAMKIPEALNLEKAYINLITTSCSECRDYFWIELAINENMLSYARLYYIDKEKKSTKVAELDKDYHLVVYNPIMYSRFLKTAFRNPLLIDNLLRCPKNEE